MKKKKPKIGSIVWRDLTVKNAAKVRDFYSAVVGWKSQSLSMGAYDDYCMNTPVGDETVAGVCHARGVNKGLPPQWLMYVTVADVDESAKACVAHGGKVLVKPRPLGEGRSCVIEDPAGAVIALCSD